jgi:hypothetical protein
MAAVKVVAAATTTAAVEEGAHATIMAAMEEGATSTKAAAEVEPVGAATTMAAVEVGAAVDANVAGSVFTRPKMRMRMIITRPFIFPMHCPQEQPCEEPLRHQ